jgi:hypothetical protein
MASWALKSLSRGAMGMAALASKTSDERKKEIFLKIALDADDALGMALRETTICRYLALESSSSELLLWAIGETLGGCEDLPQLLKRYEEISPDEFKCCETDGLGFRLANVLISLVSCFEKVSERHPERFIDIAREFPHWPILVTRHKAGYRKRFERIASRLELGAECPIAAESREAQYRLETPVCDLIWEEFMRDWICVSAGVRAARRMASERNQSTDLARDRKEVEKAIDIALRDSEYKPTYERIIWAAAFALHDLNKTNADVWADQVVIPYLHLKFPNWQKVDALSKFVGKNGGDAKAKREIRRALRAMARR